MKFITLFIIFLTAIDANDIRYNFHISNHTPYKNEAIVLDVNITQEDHSQVMLFKFTLQKSKAYKFHQIDFKENDKYHHLKHQYRYLIYPKEEGNCSLEFEMLKSLTDDDKVAYAISGDRDNVKKLVKKDIKIELQPLILNVKALPKGSEIVGDFSLNYTLDKSSTDAYDPVHLNVVLEGKGNVSPWLLIPKSEKYHLFTQAPKVKTLHTSKGTEMRMVWDYAISAKEDFTLPEVLLKAFNPQTQKNYNLKIPAQSIMVKKIDKTTLLDSEDSPLMSTKSDWSWLWMLFSYVAVFVAGYLFPKDWFKRKVVIRKSKEERLNDTIKSAKTHKELLQLLVVQDDEQYREAVALLESVVYNGKKMSLEKIKKML
ncbi:BatD family protein [bacterium]|nr:BatD family protein [bacterium]